MLRTYRKVAIAVGAVVASLSVLRTASATPAPVLIENGQTVDNVLGLGWNISAPAGVSLTATNNNGVLDLEKAVVLQPGETYQIGFTPTVVSSDPATVIDLTGETIDNETGSALNGFSFVLQNPSGTIATFGGDIFVNAIGSTPGSLNGAKTILTYAGYQANGDLSTWGGAPGNDLAIDVASPGFFVLDEVPSTGGGAVVPLPAAAWQSLVGLAGLGVFGVMRQIKRRRMA
jgi:hypothetical protein